MKCLQETHVLHAAESNEWTDALREHVAQCADCAAAANVAPWMERFSKIDARSHALPDPAVVWLKAQLLRTTAVVDRVSRPMNVFQIVCYIAVGAGWAALLTWKWEALQVWLSTLTSARILIGGAGLSVASFVLVFVLTSLTVMVALHTILADES
ncbi:MAG TPA: hypothetical protein VN181_14885 [Thermoanaerobaculia bacterium]|nr:hypothetical protein [Thermoanaerobaculia bacterium]